MPFPFRYFLGGMPLQKGCPIIMLIYLITNLTTVFTCVSAYTIGDALFAAKPRKVLTAEYFLSRTWNYYIVFIFITSCLREFLWVSIAAVGITLLAFFGILLEVPGLVIPFLIYEISVNLFFSYVKILWCAVFGLAMHAPVEFVISCKLIAIENLSKLSVKLFPQAATTATGGPTAIRLPPARAPKPVTRVFSDETKMVIYHLQEALLDIIDLNLRREDLKAAVSDYMAELLEAGPAYLEVEKGPEKHGQRSNPGKVLPQAASSLKQCPPQQLSKSKLNFPFTGQDPRLSVMQDNANMYKSPQKPPLKLSATPPNFSTPKSNLRHQSDPVTRVYQPPADSKAFSHGAELHSEQPFNVIRRGDSVRRNLFSAKRADCYHRNRKPNSTFVKPLSPQNAAVEKENCVMNDYIEEFEKYIEHKYSSECVRLKDTGDQEVRSPISFGEDEEMPEYARGQKSTDDSSGGDDNSPKSGLVFQCPPSRFELFLQKASRMESPADVPLPPEPAPAESTEDQPLESCENDNPENGRDFMDSRFERFVRDFEMPSSDSAESMTEEEFYRELMRIKTPKKS